MSCSRAGALGLALVAAASLGSCTKSGQLPSGTLERLAIVPIENLTSDASLGWITAAATSQLAYDLTGPPHVYAARVDSAAQTQLVRANRVLEGYFAEEKGALAFHATLRDPVKQATIRTMTVTAAPAGVAAAIDQLAKDLNPAARNFGTPGAEAFRLYGEALDGHADFEALTRAHPKFSAAWLAWVESRLAHQDVPGAQKAAAAALASDTQMNAIDRAQIQYLVAMSGSEAGPRLHALTTLANLLPSEPEVLRTLGNLQYERRDFKQAVRSLHQATQIDPGNPSSWNVLGYARAEMRDLDGARDALKHYIELQPNDPNAQDSLGEISYYFGDFPAAEGYFLAAYAKNPGALGSLDLLKAAQARLMTGDVPGADKIFGQYYQLRKQRQPGAAEYEQAQWLFLTGRGQQAIDKLKGMQTNPVIAMQLAIWMAQTGQAEPPDALASAGPLGQAALLLLKGQDASGVLQPLYRQATPATDGQIRALLAWSEMKSRPAEAAKLVDLYPIPLGASGEPVFASLAFPRFLQVRGTLLHSEKDLKLWNQLTASNKPAAP